MLNKEVLVEMYETKGLSTRAVAKELGVSSATVQKYLKMYGIHLRTKSQSRRLHFEKNETVNSEFFTKMSPELAYILGLWITDGCAYERGSYSIGLKDKEVIEWIVDTIGYKNKIWEIHEKRNNSTRYFIQFTNQSVKNVFDKYKIVPNKSLKTEFPESPKQYLPHFIRGVFEGDGHIGKHGYSYTVSIVGASEEFISSVKDIIEYQIGGNRTVKHDKRGNGLFLYNIYGKESIAKLGKWIYPEGTFGMQRKQNKFLELIESLL
jgi:hypothetical protein